MIGLLASHPRRDEVTAMLVEADPQNAAPARRGAAAAGLDQVQVRQGDASRPQTFADALPADALLLCGIFGNVSDVDIERTAAAAPALCAPGATVIWTRHRRPPDLTLRIRAWFTDAGLTRWRSRTWRPPPWQPSESAGSAMPRPLDYPRGAARSAHGWPVLRRVAAVIKIVPPGVGQAGPLDALLPRYRHQPPAL